MICLVFNSVLCKYEGFYFQHIILSSINNKKCVQFFFNLSVCMISVESFSSIHAYILSCGFRQLIEKDIIPL